MVERIGIRRKREISNMANFEVTYTYYIAGEYEEPEAYYKEVEAESKLDAMRKVEAEESDIVALDAKEV